MLWGVLCVLFVVMALDFVSRLHATRALGKSDLSSYHHASRLVHSGQAQHIYEFGVGKLRDAGKEFGYPFPVPPYIYPPLFAWVMMPLGSLGFKSACNLWFGLSLIWLFAALGCLLYCFPRKLPARRWAVLVFVLVALCFDSVCQDLRVGNISLLMLLLWSLILVLTLRQRDWGAGALLGVAFIIKLTPAIVLPYFVLTRRWRALAGFAASVVVLGVLSFYLFGPDCHRAFFLRMKQLQGGTAIGYYRNQSITGFLVSLFMDTPQQIAPFHVPGLVRPLASALNVLLMLPTLYLLWRRRQHVFYCFSLLAAACCLVAPISWGHHLAVLLIPLAWLVVRATQAARRCADPNRLLFLGGTGIVLGMLLIIQSLFPDPPHPVRGLFTVLTLSRQFYGTIMLWGILAWIGCKAMDDSDEFVPSRVKGHSTMEESFTR